MPYMNPYYSVGYAQPIYVQQPVATSAATITPTNFDYSRPLNLDSTPPDQATVDAAIAKFDSARDAFKSGDYALALQLTDEALTSLPNDVAIQEFRGLVLFALRDYERAAATIYSVLSVGPGWDWATMIDLYPDLDTYTQQLRTLEAYRDAHLDQPGPRFVLGYQYLCEGYPDAAIAEFKEVVKLKPNDKLTADLLKKLSSQSASNPAETPPAAPAEETPPPTPTPTAGNTTPAGAKPTEFAGNWTATPASGVSINLTMDSDGNFTWTVNQQGGPVKISGQATLSDGVMTLNSTSNGPMVGRVTKNGPNEFKLKAVGTDESDPGLTFKKAN
jgi:tetratricopeptide (TPR) repeat protein